SLQPRRTPLLLDSAHGLFDFGAVRADSRDDRLELLRTDAELFGFVVQFVTFAAGHRAPVLRAAFAPIVCHDNPPFKCAPPRRTVRRLNDRRVWLAAESDGN